MITSAPAASHAPLSRTANLAKSKLPYRQIAGTVGSILLWPAFAAGYLIFGITEDKEPTTAPFKSAITPEK